MAQEWDVFGVPFLIALDNGRDFMSNASILAYMLTGTILLRVPPKRGDLKGLIERTQGTFETKYISRIPGYVPRTYAGLNPRYTKHRMRAEAAATMTVAEYEALMVENILQFNSLPHPRLGRRRIDIYRSGLELAPPLLLTGRLQVRATFAITYEVQLTREGVAVENLKFNSAELHESYRRYTGNVFVKLDPDDIRVVLVFLPKDVRSSPIEAFLTTFSYSDAPITLELYRMTLRSYEAEKHVHGNSKSQDLPYVFAEHLARIQSFSEPSVPTSTSRKETQVAVQVAAMPQVENIENNPSALNSLSELLGASRLNDD